MNKLLHYSNFEVIVSHVHSGVKCTLGRDLVWIREITAR
jgi:hypothetical protein